MVKVVGVPIQPLAFGVTVIVAIMGVNPEFVAIKLEMFPLPDAAKPMEGVSFVQSKVVTITLPVNRIVPLVLPLHFTRLVIEVTFGFGFTVILNVLDKPGQLLADGVTVIVAIIGVTPVFMAVNEGIVSLPDGAIPMLITLDDQVYVAPEIFPEKFISVVVSPAQRTTSAVLFTSGLGFTETTTSKGKPAQPLNEGITA